MTNFPSDGGIDPGPGADRRGKGDGGVLFPGGVSAPYVPFREIVVQDLPHPGVEVGIDLPQTLAAVLVDGALGNAEFGSRRPHGGMGAIDVRGDLRDALGNALFHERGF